MAVLRIVANLEAGDPPAVGTFYAKVFGIDVMMDLGWIVTLAGESKAAPQLSLASEGGSGQPLPAVTLEVDDLDAVLQRAASIGVTPEHGPVTEPWGAYRAFLRDPAGNLLNVMMHRAP